MIILKRLKIRYLKNMSSKIVVRSFEIACLGAFFLLPGCRFWGTDAREKLSEGEQYYLSGTSSGHAGKYEESTYYLKQAEDALLSIKASDLSLPEQQKRDSLLGLTWFHLGNSSESEMLYDIAQEYYRKAIPLLTKEKNDTYLACAYRDIARTTALTGGETDSVLLYFEKADRFARAAQSEVLQLDIDAYRYQLCYPDSVAHRLKVCKVLAEQYGVHTRYSEIVELLLAEQKTDSAAFYLRHLQPRDSSYAYWFEQSYAYLQSKILRQQRQADEAYAILLDLYDRKIEELQRDAGARTYALSLHYDVQREQQLAQEAGRERRWQRTVSVILVLLLVMVVMLLFVSWRYWQQRRREQNAALKALQDKYTQQLQLALERLQQKVNLTKEIELQRLRGNEVSFPKWLQTYRDEQLTMNKDSIDELIQSVDTALDGAISRLRNEYPKLTESDMQFAILSIIGASDSDQGILLNVQKQTIYHRRQLVRKHIIASVQESSSEALSASCMSQYDDIDAFLRGYVLPN